MHEIAMDNMLPSGIVVPSENVKSFSTLRLMEAAEVSFDWQIWRYQIRYVHAASGDNRIVSLTKLSSLLIFVTESLLQPRSWITDSISSRKGCTYSG